MTGKSQHLLVLPKKNLIFTKHVKVLCLHFIPILSLLSDTVIAVLNIFLVRMSVIHKKRDLLTSMN